MTSATRSVAVVATRLPSIDRRALSQAWYSALHVAAPQSGAAGPRGPVGAGAPMLTANRSCNVTAAGPHVGGGRSDATALKRSEHPQRGAMPPERRAPAGELARRIERAIVRHGRVSAQQGKAISLSVGDGRVQLLVRTDGGATRIVALCPAHLRERVDRALASARYTLTAAGTHVEFVS